MNKKEIHSPLVITTSGLPPSILKRYKYKVFGEMQYESGTYYDNHKFTGKEEDGSGLYYFGARYYDKSLGRWMSPDPASYPSDLRLNDPQSFNPYVYCRNNPLALKDPDGTAYYEVGTGEVQTIEQVKDLLFVFAADIHRNEYAYLPVYSEAGTPNDEIKSIGGFKKGWRTILFEMIVQSSSVGFNYGKKIKTVEGNKRFLFANLNPINLNKKVMISKSPYVLDKTEDGKDLIRIEYYSKPDIFIMALTGTIDNLNVEFEKVNLQIVKTENFYEPYKLVEIDKETE